MKFALALYTGSSNPKFYGISRTWYVSGDGDGARWTPAFEGARLMDLPAALEVYKRLDSPFRQMGLVPVE